MAAALALLASALCCLAPQSMLTRPRRSRVLALLALCSMAPRLDGQQPRAKRVSVAIVEADTGSIQHTLTIAALVRAKLERYAKPDQLGVVRRKDVLDTCLSDCPQPWTPQFLSDLATLVRADLVVELSTWAQGGEVTARALVYHPHSSAVDTLPRIHGVTDSAVADQLAGYLSAMLLRLHDKRLDKTP